MSERPKLAGAQNGGARDQEPKRQKTIGDFLNDEGVRKRMAGLLGDVATTERFVRLAMQAVQKTPKLQQCDPLSVLGAFMACAALRLEPNTPLGQAYLIPYEMRRPTGRIDDRGKQIWGSVVDCQLQIGYRGFVTLAFRAGVTEMRAETVRSGDRFDHDTGTEMRLSFSKALQHRGAPVAAFAYARLGEGGQAFIVLPIDEIEKIRGRSETYRSLSRAVAEAQNDTERRKAEAKLADTPWVLWFDEMAAKSAIKRLIKQLPLGEAFNPAHSALAQASVIDGAGDDSRIDLKHLAHMDQFDIIDAEPAAIEAPRDEQVANFGPLEREGEREPVMAQQDRSPDPSPEPPAANGPEDYGRSTQRVNGANNGRNERRRAF